MEIKEVEALVKRIHDAEGYNLGTASSREYRNKFWARAIGCVHHGHPIYNLTPDSRWHIKDAGGGRPQSDDVVVLMPSRDFWDCIPGAGADGYSFRANYDGILPMDQNVYAPPVPSGSAGQPGPTPVPPPAPVAESYPDEPTFWKKFQDRMIAAYAAVGRVFPDQNDADAYRRFSRCGFDIGRGMSGSAAANKHIKELREELGAPAE